MNQKVLKKIIIKSKKIKIKGCREREILRERGHFGHFKRGEERKVVSGGWEDNFSKLRGGHCNFSNVKGTLCIKGKTQGRSV